MEFEEAVKTAPADLKTVREKAIDKAVEIVAELNRDDKVIRLNDIVFPQKGYESSIQDGFMARAKELIFNATRPQIPKTKRPSITFGVHIIERVAEDLPLLFNLPRNTARSLRRALS